jgi:hypothetical protein
MTTENETENPFQTAERWEPYLDQYIREEGNYVAEITEIEGGSTQANNPKLIIQLVAKQGSIRDWLNYDEGRTLGKVTSLYEAAGVPLPKEGEFDPSDHCRLTDACIGRLRGRRVGIVVRNETSLKDPAKQVLAVQGYVLPSRITDDAPADTRGLPDVGAAATQSPNDDFPFLHDLAEPFVWHGHANR